MNTPLERGRAADVARLVLHLRESARAARRLGILHGGIGPRLAANMLLVELEQAARGLRDVPELKLQETELPQRVALRELLDELRAAFSD